MQSFYFINKVWQSDIEHDILSGWKSFVPEDRCLLALPKFLSNERNNLFKKQLDESIDKYMDIMKFNNLLLMCWDFYMHEALATKF